MSYVLLNVFYVNLDFILREAKSPRMRKPRLIGLNDC